LRFHEEFGRVAQEIGAVVDCPSWVSWSADGSRSELEDVVERTPYPGGRGRGRGGGDDDPFLVVYTGGTTGTSKGAVHNHRTAMAAMAAMEGNTVGEGVVPTDRFMLTGQMSHSPVLLAISYLTHGCPVVMVDFLPALGWRSSRRSGSPPPWASRPCPRT
jgi:long-chain acyl-CoA synthetase